MKSYMCSFYSATPGHAPSAPSGKLAEAADSASIYLLLCLSLSPSCSVRLYAFRSFFLFVCIMFKMSLYRSFHIYFVFPCFFLGLCVSLFRSFVLSFSRSLFLSLFFFFFLQVKGACEAPRPLGPPVPVVGAFGATTVRTSATREGSLACGT